LASSDETILSDWRADAHFFEISEQGGLVDPERIGALL
jgi:hypothetical protein